MSFILVPGKEQSISTALDPRELLGKGLPLLQYVSKNLEDMEMYYTARFSALPTKIVIELNPDDAWSLGLKLLEDEELSASFRHQELTLYMKKSCLHSRILLAGKTANGRECKAIFYCCDPSQFLSN